MKGVKNVCGSSLTQEPACSTHKPTLQHLLMLRTPPTWPPVQMEPLLHAISSSLMLSTAAGGSQDAMPLPIPSSFLHTMLKGSA